jgi:hypothetical protein
MARRRTPARGANFQSKSVRKRIRRGMIRGYVGNKVADARVASRERAEFYRNLRQMKMRRRKIAAEMAVLAEMMTGLRREIGRVGDRNRNVDMRYVEEALMLAKTADSSVSTAAAEFYAFSRRRIYFTEAMAA